jgi:outer membrane lipoprotein carrier protein
MRLGLVFIAAIGFLFPGAFDNPTEVTSLLRKFEKTYKSAKTLRATFLERYFDNDREVRSEAGTAYFSKPGKMRWEYGSPEANIYIVDGKWSWFYVPSDHTVTRIRAKESFDARTPLALLAGEMKVSRLCKSVDLDRASRPATPHGVVLRCILRGSDDVGPAGTTMQPVAPSSHRDYALFELDPDSGELLRVVVADPGGVKVEFQFANWAFDPRVEDSKFHFLAPKGVAIVDGRLSASPDATAQNQVR